MKNPSSFLKLTVPQKILSVFDSFLASRTLQTPQDLQLTQFQQVLDSDATSVPPLMKTKEICAHLSSKS